MHILVCVKQVPDSREIRIDPVTQTLIREGVPSIVNIYDQHATEEAVRLREKLPGAHVTVLSMGPPMAVNALRECIALGADRAVLVSDRAFAGADTLATSFVLAAAARKVAAEWGPLDLVFAGKQTLDGDTGQVGPGLACRLGFEPLTYVEAIESVDLERRRIRVHRHLEHGVMVVETSLPSLIAVTETINQVRRASLPSVIRSIRYQPVTWTVNDFPEIDRTKIGLRGSPTVVGKAWVPEPVKRGGQRLEEATTAPDAIASQVFSLLEARRLPEVLGWSQNGAAAAPAAAGA
jgi:electron transfer flavoprotein beta subunit